ncbi:MAG: helix-turn-helix domain-containing protein [Sulfuriferula sp.]
MNTLTLRQAAELLKIHPVTLQEKARAGDIPGAKIGKCWVFVEFDLIEYIRSQYRRRALQGEQKEVSLCHSSNARIRLIGGSKSPTTDDQYSKALGLPIERKPRNTTTS